MTVLVECFDATIDCAQLESELRQRLREALSVQIAVNAKCRGELDEYTGLSRTSKIKRLDDRRKS